MKRSLPGRRAVPWLFAAFLALAVGVPTCFSVSATRSLDRGFTHTRATEALPLLAPRAPNGLVRIQARGFVFRARVAGLANPGPALMLLHGWPETSVMWEPLVDAAAAAGFRVVAFDQRGYSPGARPDALAAYEVPELTADALAVADELGFERFHLVGHDWGSVVGWSLAANEPDRVASWASLSIPHPGAIGVGDGNGGTPLYIRFFRLEGVAETLLLAGNLYLLRNGLYNAPMPPEVIDEYVAVFSEPGALRAAFNWYRALGGVPGAVGPVAQPVLHVYGRRDMDVFTNDRVIAAQEDFLVGEHEVIALDAGHWLIQEQPDRVVEAVLAHVRRSEQRRQAAPS